VAFTIAAGMAAGSLTAAALRRARA